MTNDDIWQILLKIGKDGVIIGFIPTESESSIFYSVDTNHIKYNDCTRTYVINNNLY